MKQLKRVFAMILCVAMLLPLFMTFSGVAKATYCVYYNSLNDIPENANIFRSIRTGTITHVKSGNDWYYRFFEKGYPEVNIKETAFMEQATNGYLTEDNLQLSQNCKNTATIKDGDDYWSVQRVCYYKITSPVRDATPYSENRTYIYTQSMYRLELSANAEASYQVIVDAKLTSGVTFEYNARTSELTRKSKLPLAPIVELVVHDGPEVDKYKITGKAPQMTINDITDTLGLIWSGKACIGGIGGTGIIASAMILVPETVPALSKVLVVEAGKTAIDCGFFIRDVNNKLKEADSKELYDSGYIESKSQTVMHTSPLKLKNSDNHVRATYILSSNRSSSTYFTINFGFNNVKS